MESNFLVLLRRVGLLLLIFFFCRLLFLFFNYSYFSSIDFVTIVSSFFFGLRYDITAIVITNIFLISFHIIPFPFFYRKWYQLFLKIIFLLVNVPVILLNCIDLGLFRFTGKRSGAEIFSIMGFGDDFINTLPKMISDFWYLLLIFAVICYLLIRLYPKVRVNQKRITAEKKSLRSIAITSLLFILFAGMTFVGFRGGIQYKPLNILSASRYGPGKTAALVLNTPFTIIKTYGKQTIEEVHWMSEAEALKICPLRAVPNNAKTFTSKNVVIIILESFGKEYIGSLNSYEGYTPFLDSLIGQSLVFTNAYANGKRSIEGIPAVVAGIPALMNDPFITSAYSGNSVTSIASLLKPKGYSSVFFHGGTDGTMGFDNFSKLAGFDHYFGRTEYNDDKDFDGSWGIYDEPFLQRTASEINNMKQPLFATIFTLSSHHPYKIPDKYVDRFKEGSLPIHQSIRYADYSLKRFFDVVQKMPWYHNTVFVITGDHTAIPEYPFYRNRVGMYADPIIYFSPSDSTLQGMNTTTTQQIDILPGVLDYLGYDQPYFAFGKSPFSKSEDGFASNFLDETYQLISGEYSFVLDTTGTNSLYQFTSDSTLRNDVAGKEMMISKKMELKLKAFIQNFNHAMINNEMK